MYDEAVEHALSTYKFTGKERDAESGLDNFTARYLGSSLGRFMSPDPMGGHQDDPQTLNRYAYVRNNPLKFTDPTGMNFGLPCSGGNTDTCNNGLQGSWQHDKDGNKTTFDPISIGNKDGQLQDVSSNKTGTYTASFDGSNVSLTNSSGATQNGSWLQGTAAVEGIKGGGQLSDKFTFTFEDHGAGNQRLNASWTFAGTVAEAEAALEKAHFRNYGAGENAGMDEYRSRGTFWTGADSGHFNVFQISLTPWLSVPQAQGDMHVGEHNPFGDPFGFGTVAHCVSDRAGVCQ